MNQNVTQNVQNQYDNQYLSIDDKWRMLGGKQKSSNIVRLCNFLNVKNMIDVGSGNGAVLQFLNDSNFTNDIFSVEISNSGIDKINLRNMKNLKEVKKFDGYKIPYDDKSFHLSTCSHVIEHVEHPRLLLREISRISEYQFFEIPIDFSFSVDQKVNHYLAYGHINIYTPSLFKFLLKTEGYEIIKEDFLFSSNEIINFQFEKSLTKRLIQKLKNFIVKNTPLKNIKPNAYCVLCKHSGKNLEIF